ncbi:phosphate ABC transporter substrate-binding protein PstS [Nonomuraea sp. NEAU-A123]|uniref:phosphate ABC transporter substrate-binding protein PstS n=1 Tax=Nonomuraea sp. NEAU-A123 TaxID=2839649 RepID=UPI001BE478C3|nr:phosphate ABC transporter substrate-binding protein PstS [Nonomuraea sp. NEAU-A123]MBT2229798.1 phosphate ABC transporter substrate-binding protein PstS [Nonomuraea sp. NEAU-A123]
MEKLTGIAGLVVLVALALAASAAGLGGTAILARDEVPESPPITASISGSGSTAQKGAMDAWRAEFHRIHPDLRVDYQANGSGAGIRDFIAGTTAFAGSDVAMQPWEQTLADRRCGSRAVHLPMVVGPIALAYNLPSTPDLKLSPITLTGIFSGRITTWDASEIAADNRGRRLPHAGIRLFHRSDESGTTHNFTTYLKAAGRWPYQPSRDWTGSGQGVAGSSGIADAVQRTTGSIGYVEYGFASNARLRTAKVRNASGQFVALSPQSATEALEGARVVGKDDDLVVKFDYLTESEGAYPIILITYEIACSKTSDPLVRSFLRYTAGDGGQSYLSLYGYAPLPRDLLAKVRARLDVPS